MNGFTNVFQFLVLYARVVSSLTAQRKENARLARSWSKTPVLPLTHLGSALAVGPRALIPIIRTFSSSSSHRSRRASIAASWRSSNSAKNLWTRVPKKVLDS